MYSRNIFLAAIIVLSGFSAIAQNNPFKVKLTGPAANQKVVFTNVFNELFITGTTGDEIVITGDESAKPPAEAQGLKLLSPYGDDNTGLGLNVSQQNGVIQIAGVNKNSDGKLQVQVPAAMTLDIESEVVNANDVHIENISGEVDAKVNFSSQLTLKGISGPVVLYTLNGDITATFATLAQSKPSSISSVNGKVDITMPANSPANFKLSSINGQIYSDLDLKTDAQDVQNMRHIGGGMKTDATNAGGGVEMTISTINDNIYLRKSK